MTWAQHLQGLGETFEGIGSGGGRDPAKSSGIGIFGFLAVMVVVMLRFRAMDCPLGFPSRTASWLVPPSALRRGEQR